MEPFSTSSSLESESSCGLAAHGVARVAIAYYNIVRQTFRQEVAPIAARIQPSHAGEGSLCDTLARSSRGSPGYSVPSPHGQGRLSLGGHRERTACERGWHVNEAVRYTKSDSMPARATSACMASSDGSSCPGWKRLAASSTFGSSARSPTVLRKMPGRLSTQCTARSMSV